MTATALTGPPPLRQDRRVAVLLGQALYVAVVAIAVSMLIGAASTAGMLIPVALPLGLGLVAAMAWLPARAQHLGWAALSVWLLSAVYLGHGDREYAALAVVVLLGIAGTFASPWFLVGLWLLHPVWDLLPRDLPAAQQDLPHACLLYDLVVAAYLAWRIRRGGFLPVGARAGERVGWAADTARGGALRVGLATWAVLVTAGQALASVAVPDARTATLVAVPLAGLVILALSRLPGPAQLPAWALLTGWVGMTYAHSGAALEVVVFLAIVLLAVLGVRSGTGYLAAAWTFHALWNLLPRDHSATHGTFMGHWIQWPWAGLLFEGSIAGYLLHRTWRETKGMPSAPAVVTAEVTG